MRFEGKYTFRPKPYGPDEFIVPHEVDVVCYTGDENSVVAGRVAFDFLDIMRAEIEGESVLNVCDADSGGWSSVYSALIEPAAGEAKIRKDFCFDDPVNGLVFLHRTAFHPSLRDWQRLIIDRICGMFREDTAAVMWRKETDMTDKELASLGFRIVAGCDLLFRPNMFRNEYSAADDPRSAFDLHVPIDAPDYVEAQWALRESA